MLPGLPPEEQISFPISTPSTSSTAHDTSHIPIPGTIVLPRNNPLPGSSMKKGFSFPNLTSNMHSRRGLPPQTRKKGLTKARWCVGCCLSLPGSRVPVQTPGPTCCVILSVTQPLWASRVSLNMEENTSCLSGLRIILVHIHEASDIRQLLKKC